VLVSTLEGELGISDQTREYLTTVSTIEKKWDFNTWNGRHS